MRNRRPLTTIATTAAVLAAMALPAGAADTTTTFVLSAGSLTVSAPGTAVSLPGGAAGAGTISGPLGTVAVTDARGALIAAWTATALSTGFVNGTTTIAPTAVSYASGTGTQVTGLPLMVGTVGAVADLTTAKTVMTATAVGSNAGSWNPTVSVTIPATAVAGTYTATITHSVS